MLRVIATTKRNLSILARAGAFREDLFCRPGVAHLALPGLRERRE